VTPETNLASLILWLETNVPDMGNLLKMSKFPGGQSNPTYRLSTANGQYVLRRQPSGRLLPQAHAVDREYRFLQALYPTGFPVPRPVAFCRGPETIGSMFYIMELVQGRIFWDATLPNQTSQERRSLYQAMIATLAQLHSINPDIVGLGDFRRPGNAVKRQVDRWIKQYRAAQTDEIPAMERLVEWLPRTAPEQSGVAIVHGDYRIDNLIYQNLIPEVAALLDWELATIGDPLADFAYLAMNWALPPDGRSGLVGAAGSGSGIPALEEAVALYCAATGRDGVPHLHWYFAYNLFRLTSIVQGVKKRSMEGNASSTEADQTVARLRPLSDAAWEQARMAGARS
jgi:aminoglycoside phosphotransferase (APT) family kinase protein